MYSDKPRPKEEMNDGKEDEKELGEHAKRATGRKRRGCQSLGRRVGRGGSSKHPTRSNKKSQSMMRNTYRFGVGDVEEYEKKICQDTGYHSRRSTENTERSTSRSMSRSKSKQRGFHGSDTTKEHDVVEELGAPDTQDFKDLAKVFKTVSGCHAALHCSNSITTFELPDNSNVHFHNGHTVPQKVSKDQPAFLSRASPELPHFDVALSYSASALGESIISAQIGTNMEKRADPELQLEDILSDDEEDSQQKVFEELLGNGESTGSSQLDLNYTVKTPQWHSPNPAIGLGDRNEDDEEEYDNNRLDSSNSLDEHLVNYWGEPEEEEKHYLTSEEMALVIYEDDEGEENTESILAADLEDSHDIKHSSLLEEVDDVPAIASVLLEQREAADDEEKNISWQTRASDLLRNKMWPEEYLEVFRYSLESSKKWSLSEVIKTLEAGLFRTKTSFECAINEIAELTQAEFKRKDRMWWQAEYLKLFFRLNWDAQMNFEYCSEQDAFLRCKLGKVKRLLTPFEIPPYPWHDGWYDDYFYTMENHYALAKI